MIVRVIKKTNTSAQSHPSEKNNSRSRKASSALSFFSSSARNNKITYNRFSTNNDSQGNVLKEQIFSIKKMSPMIVNELKNMIEEIQKNPIFQKSKTRYQAQRDKFILQLKKLIPFDFKHKQFINGIIFFAYHRRSWGTMNNNKTEIIKNTKSIANIIADLDFVQNLKLPNGDRYTGFINPSIREDEKKMVGEGILLRRKNDGSFEKFTIIDGNLAIKGKFKLSEPFLGWFRGTLINKNPYNDKHHNSSPNDWEPYSGRGKITHLGGGGWYKGTFKEKNFYNGMGNIYYPDGRHEKGEWINGVFFPDEE